VGLTSFGADPGFDGLKIRVGANAEDGLNDTDERKALESGKSDEAEKTVEGGHESEKVNGSVAERYDDRMNDPDQTRNAESTNNIEPQNDAVISRSDDEANDVESRNLTEGWKTKDQRNEFDSENGGVISRDGD
jgi:hypothetical protein